MTDARDTVARQQDNGAKTDARRLKRIATSVLEQGRAVRLPLQGGSMVFTMPPGSEIVVVPRQGIRVGGVYVYSCGDVLIAHRLIRVERRADETLCVFRGEAETAELERIHMRNIIGRVTSVRYRGLEYSLDHVLYRALSCLWIRSPALARWVCGAVALLCRAWPHSQQTLADVLRWSGARGAASGSVAELQRVR